MDDTIKQELITFLKNHQDDIKKFHLSKLLSNLEDIIMQSGWDLQDMEWELFKILKKMEDEGKYIPDYYVGAYEGDDNILMYVDNNNTGFFENAVKFKNKIELIEYIKEFSKNYDLELDEKNCLILGLKD